MRRLALVLLSAALLCGQEPVQTPQDRLQTQALAYAESQAADRPGTYTFKVIGHSLLPRTAQEEMSFEAAHLSRPDLAGRFFVTYNVLSGGRNLGMVRVDLDGRWTGSLLKFRTAAARRTVPTEEELEPVDFEGAPPAGALGELPAGFRLRNPVLAGHLLTQADLEPIPLVNLGDTVRVEVVDGSLSIRMDALALGSGAEGARIRLELPSSHKFLQAVVTGPGEARVVRGGAK